MSFRELYLLLETRLLIPKLWFQEALAILFRSLVSEFSLETRNLREQDGKKRCPTSKGSEVHILP